MNPHLTWSRLVASDPGLWAPGMLVSDVFFGWRLCRGPVGTADGALGLVALNDRGDFCRDWLALAARMSDLELATEDGATLGALRGSLRRLCSDARSVNVSHRVDLGEWAVVVDYGTSYHEETGATEAEALLRALCWRLGVEEEGP